jgi:hypothetical protein
MSRPKNRAKLFNVELPPVVSGRTSRRERNLTHLTELGRLVMPMLKQCYESTQPMALKKFQRSLGSMRLQYR